MKSLNDAFPPSTAWGRHYGCATNICLECNSGGLLAEVTAESSGSLKKEQGLEQRQRSGLGESGGGERRRGWLVKPLDLFAVCFGMG